MSTPPVQNANRCAMLLAVWGVLCCFGACLQVTYRLTYEDVEDMLANGIAGSSEEWELGRLDELARLRHRFLERGAILLLSW